jgi:hypothetical protein
MQPVKHYCCYLPVHVWTVFRRVCENCEKRTLPSSCLSVRLHRTTRLPLDEFSWNLIFEDFSKICSGKIQVSLISDKNNGYLYMTYIPLWKYLAEFFLEWEMFQTKFVEKIKTHILCWITSFFFRKSCRLWDNAGKYGTARQVIYDNIIQRMRFACWVTKATYSYTHIQNM